MFLERLYVMYSWEHFYDEKLKQDYYISPARSFLVHRMSMSMTCFLKVS